MLQVKYLISLTLAIGLDISNSFEAKHIPL